MRSTASTTLALLVGLAPAAFAGGNVTVFVDQAGDLHILGDDNDNSLSVRDESGTDGEFVLADDLGTTTVNGAPSLVVHASGKRILVSMAGGKDRIEFGGGGYVCCEREVVFSGGDGDDEFRLVDESSALDALMIDLGPGNDLFEAGEGSALRALELSGGDGDDTVLVGPYVDLGGDVHVDLGPGADVLDWRGQGTRGSVTILGGADADELRIDGLDVRGFVSIAGGGGDDRIEIGSVRGFRTAEHDLAQPLLVDAGDGDDQVLLFGACTQLEGVIVRAGNGRDSVEFSGARVEASCTVELGTGDDRLAVAGSTLGLAGPRFRRGAGARPRGAIRFEGGAGTDLYAEFADNAFPRGAPVVSGFEKPELAQPHSPDVPTRVTGRVVLIREPVEAATVAIPELGLTTSTDASGVFQIDVPATQPHTLALTAGATRGGGHACGAWSFHPAPYSEVDLGELELRSDCSSALLFGDAEGDAATLEGILRASGLGATGIERARFLPEDLSAYALAWFVPDSAPLTEAEVERLASFVRSGGGLHLAGDTPAIVAANEALVNALVAGGGVRLGIPQGSAEWFPLVYAPDAEDDVSRVPNALGAVMDFITGGLALDGVTHPHVFIEGAGGQVFAAVWSETALTGRRGRLSAGLSTFWFRSSTNAPAIENLFDFLAPPPRFFSAR